jgi:RND superfamily putative drug exporter
MSASRDNILSRLVVGRRRRFAVLAVWLLGAAALGPLAGRFEQSQQNEPSTFLPGGAESVKVLEAAKGFPSGEQTPAVAVFRNPDGLGARGRAAVEQTRATLRAASIEGVSGISPVAWSPDGTAAVVSVPIRAEGDSDLLVSAVEHVRTTVEKGLPPGLEAPSQLRRIRGGWVPTT